MRHVVRVRHVAQDLSVLKVGVYLKWAVSGCSTLEADRVEYVIFSQIKPYIIGKLITQGIQIF